MSNSGPYSNHTLHALTVLGRAVRGVCFAMDRFDCPAAVSRRLRTVRKLCRSLAYQLTLDYAVRTHRVLGNIPPVLKGAAIIAGAAAFGWLVGGTGG